MMFKEDKNKEEIVLDSHTIFCLYQSMPWFCQSKTGLVSVFSNSHDRGNALLFASPAAETVVMKLPTEENLAK